MADLKYTKDIQVGASRDGSDIVLKGATEEEGALTVSFKSSLLQHLIPQLLRLAADPNIFRHTEPKTSTALGTLNETRPFRVNRISVGEIPILPAVALILDFPGVDCISTAMSLDEADQLIGQLKGVLRNLRSTQIQKPQ